MFHIIQKLFILLLLMRSYKYFTSSLKFPFHLADLRTHTLKGNNRNAFNIHIINNNTWYNEQDIFENHDFIQNKKLISISPGGYKGFYVLGICKYIKEHYDLRDYIFTGASAGAWNSLILCFNGNTTDIEKYLVDEEIQNSTSIYQMEQNLKRKILQKYTTNDFDLRKVFIGVTTIHKYYHNTTIFTGFQNLEDAINCCIASSHIPLVTGGLKHVYHNFISLDGGFSKYPYLNITKPVLHITPSIWKKDENNFKKRLKIIEYTTLFSKNNFIFTEMVAKGYQDAHDNKDILDKIFL
jgi:hypothetical protein